MRQKRDVYVLDGRRTEIPLIIRTHHQIEVTPHPLGGAHQVRVLLNAATIRIERNDLANQGGNRVYAEIGCAKRRSEDSIYRRDIDG